jgi:hypothetical protein
MANAEVDKVTAQVFDRKFQTDVVNAACDVANKAIQADFALGAPKDKHVRYWSVDLKLGVNLDNKSQELSVGCGVIVSIKQDGKKFLHANKPPNSAKTKVDAAKLTTKQVVSLVGDAVSSAMEKPIAMMKADSKNL